MCIYTRIALCFEILFHFLNSSHVFFIALSYKTKVHNIMSSGASIIHNCTTTRQFKTFVCESELTLHFVFLHVVCLCDIAMCTLSSHTPHKLCARTASGKQRGVRTQLVLSKPIRHSVFTMGRGLKLPSRLLCHA